jgi:hypothetical protein
MITATYQAQAHQAVPVRAEAPAEAATIPAHPTAISETWIQESSMPLAAGTWTRWILQTRYTFQLVMKRLAADMTLADTATLKSSLLLLFLIIFKNNASAIPTFRMALWKLRIKWF